MPSFLEAVQEAQRSGKVILMGGAMGTELQKTGLKENECPEAWNLEHPDRVRAVHRGYVVAGAHCLVTNTFQSNPKALARYRLKSRLNEINEAAIHVARSVAGIRHFVLASIGPMTGGSHALKRVARSLRMADGLLFETWRDDSAPISRSRIEMLRQPDVNPHGIPIIASFTFINRGVLRWDGGFLARKLAVSGVDVIGANCGCNMDMSAMVKIVRRFRKYSNLPILARPNAGTPTRVGERWVYPETPEKMAAHLPKLIEAGATLIGGCCGTTPEHIEAFREVIEKRGVAWKPTTTQA